jgi:hypothetical protein
MSVTSPIYNAPTIPNKWDIIPIHSSDRASFKRCRRYWDYNSPARRNLVLRADIHGVSLPLWFGTGIHWALEQYYQPGLSRDPVESWKTWFDVQWRGGIVTEEWLPRVYDLKPQPIINADVEGAQGKLGMPHSVSTFRVRGLEDIIPSPDHDAFDEHYTLGIEMMMFYKDYAEQHDDFEVLIAEHDFSVPVWDYEKNCVLKAIDTRLESPNYGKILEVHARGRMDGITTRPDNDRLSIIDHKTAASIGEDYFTKLETDEQCTNYLACAQIEAKYYNMPHAGKSFEEVTYNVLRKAYPKQPTELASGMFSVDRTKESTTYPILKKWIAQHLPGVALSEKQQAYVDYVRDQGDEQFIIRKHVRRNQVQLGMAMQRLYLEALDMLQQPRIYPNISNDFRCLNCQFRAPCLAEEDGGDVEQLIRDNYYSNKDR